MLMVCASIRRDSRRIKDLYTPIDLPQGAIQSSFLTNLSRRTIEARGELLSMMNRYLGLLTAIGGYYFIEITSVMIQTLNCVAQGSNSLGCYPVRDRDRTALFHPYLPEFS